MELEQALDLARNAFFTAMWTSAPILVVGMAVGLSISLFQAVTQLQEQTLSFVPKLAAMIVAAAFFIPWIGVRLLDYAREMFSTPL